VNGYSNPNDKLDVLYDFILRNNNSILSAVRKMQYKSDNLQKIIPNNSLLKMIANREYLYSPIYARVKEIDNILITAVPQMFQTEKPKNEPDLNSKIQALLSSYGKFEREFPSLLFGVTNYRADHSQDYLIIETKYVRKGTTPSKATEGIAADITKIPDLYGIFFVVYDPDHEIIPDDKFISSFEQKRNNCYVRIYR
jgi:hypothetical protein